VILFSSVASKKIPVVIEYGPACLRLVDLSSALASGAGSRRHDFRNTQSAGMLGFLPSPSAIGKMPTGFLQAIDRVRER
jgi:hypothetical protein